LGQVGEHVEAARKAAGLSVDDMATAAGVGRGTILRVEAGSVDPGIETVAAIARALGVSGAELLGKCPDWTERGKP
jgi:transcriptional regulator with XRE-family HTH domain